MLKTFSITDTGRRRKVNQDYVYSSERPVGNLPNLFLVADGMGGHNAGDYASRAAVRTIVESASASPLTDPVRILQEAIQAANTLIYERADGSAELQGMGTTVVAACCQGERLYVANVGDSRLYVAGSQGIRQITRDDCAGRHWKGGGPESPGQEHYHQGSGDRGCGEGGPFRGGS